MNRTEIEQCYRDVVDNANKTYKDAVAPLRETRDEDIDRIRQTYWLAEASFKGDYINVLSEASRTRGKALKAIRT